MVVRGVTFLGGFAPYPNTSTPIAKPIMKGSDHSQARKLGSGCGDLERIVAKERNTLT